MQASATQEQVERLRRTGIRLGAMLELATANTGRPRARVGVTTPLLACVCRRGRVVSPRTFSWFRLVAMRADRAATVGITSIQL
jgi:hypothetical protein